MPKKFTDRHERGGHHSRTVRLIIRDEPGRFAKIADAIGYYNGVLGEVKIVREDPKFIVRDVTFFTPAESSAEAAVREISDIDGVRMAGVTNEVMEAHRGGKVRVRCARPLDTVSTFRHLAFPGVLEACRRIDADPALAREYTIAGSSVGVITSGSNILGLGEIEPVAALPYAEGLAALLSGLCGLNAIPLLVDLREVYGFVNIVGRIAGTFGGIVLGGMGEPDIFEIYDRLSEGLDKPVFLAGRHGTAVAATAALINGLARAGKGIAEAEVLVHGTTEAACGTVELLKAAGFIKIIVADDKGAVFAGREDSMPEHVEKLAQITNIARNKGTLRELIKKRDAYLGFNGPGAKITRTHVKSMAARPVVLALGEPDPEIGTRAAQAAGATAADRSTVTITHGLCGIVSGTLRAAAKEVTTETCLAAARELARLGESTHELLPAVIDRDVHRRVADAVCEAAVNRQ